MTVEIIRDVLAWCSVINVGLLLILGIRVYAGPRLDLSYSWEMVQVVSGERGSMLFITQEWGFSR